MDDRDEEIKKGEKSVFCDNVDRYIYLIDIIRTVAYVYTLQQNWPELFYIDLWQTILVSGFQKQDVAVS